MKCNAESQIFSAVRPTDGGHTVGAGPTAQTLFTKKHSEPLHLMGAGPPVIASAVRPPQRKLAETPRPLQLLLKDL